MDFIMNLPPSKGFIVIMVVVDRFSKGIHLGSLASGFTAYKVAKLFVSIIANTMTSLKVSFLIEIQYLSAGFGGIFLNSVAPYYR